MSEVIDLEAFASDLWMDRDAAMMGLRQAAVEIGISASTLSRLERGEMPDLETYVKCCRWMTVDVDVFIHPDKTVIA